MASNVEQGYLVIGDISGFTPFVAGSELVHSQAILSEILKLMIRNFTPTLTIAEIEGDAVFAYIPRRQLPRGETLLEIIEATYVDFRDRRASSRRMATCDCNACQMIPLLDLKFITHHGEYILQNVSGRNKPLGSSVNLIHRLLKNKVSEHTGWRGYAMLTQESLEKMDVYPLNMHPEVESVEHLGEVSTFSVNLDDRYADLTRERRVFLAPDEADVVVESDHYVPAPILWEWLNDPRKRVRWMAGSAWEAKDRPDGRTGTGATNHCSNSHSVERILDWRPFSYYTVDMRRGLIHLTMTSRLEQVSDRIKLSCLVRLHGFLPRWLLRPLCRLVVAKGMRMRDCMVLLDRLLNEEERIGVPEAVEVSL